MTPDDMNHGGHQDKAARITTIDFHRDTLFAVEQQDGVSVAIKPICDTLGIAWNKQLERIKRDAILSEGMTIMVMPSPGGAQEPAKRQTAPQLSTARPFNTELRRGRRGPPARDQRRGYDRRATAFQGVS